MLKFGSGGRWGQRRGRSTGTAIDCNPRAPGFNRVPELAKVLSFAGFSQFVLFRPRGPDSFSAATLSIPILYLAGRAADDRGCNRVDWFPRLLLGSRKARKKGPWLHIAMTPHSRGPFYSGWGGKARLFCGGWGHGGGWQARSRFLTGLRPVRNDITKKQGIAQLPDCRDDSCAANLSLGQSGTCPR